MISKGRKNFMLRGACNRITRLLAFVILVSSLGAGTFDPYANLYRPTVGETGYGTNVSDNFTKIGESLPVYLATVPSLSVVGDLVYLTGPSTAALSDASAAGTARIDGYIYEKITSTTARIRTGGKILGLSGLTGGVLYYLDTTAGKVTATPPPISVPIGYAVNSTSIAVLTASEAVTIASGSSVSTLQDAYDNGSAAQTLDLDVGGSLAFRTNGGTPLVTVSDSGTATVVFDNATSGLAATNVQAAIDEVEARVDANDAKVSAGGSIDVHSDVDTTSTPPISGDVLQFDGSNFVPVSLPGGGDITTATNVGTAGVGVWEAKASNVLQFKTVNATDSKISIFDDAANNEIDIGLGTVSVNDLSDVDTATVPPVTGQALVWDGAQWEPGDVAGGGGGAGGATELIGKTFIPVANSERFGGYLFLYSGAGTTGSQTGTVDISAVSGGRTVPPEATHVLLRGGFDVVTVSSGTLNGSLYIGPPGTSFPDTDYFVTSTGSTTTSFTNGGKHTSIVVPLDGANPDLDWAFNETSGGTYTFLRIPLFIDGYFVDDTSVVNPLEGLTFTPAAGGATMYSGSVPAAASTQIGTGTLNLDAVAPVPTNALNAQLSVSYAANAGSGTCAFYLWVSDLDVTDSGIRSGVDPLIAPSYGIGAEDAFATMITPEINQGTANLYWYMQTQPGHTSPDCFLVMGYRLNGYFIDDSGASPSALLGRTFLPISGGPTKILEEIVPVLAAGEYSAHTIDFSDTSLSVTTSTPRVNPVSVPARATHAILRVAHDSVRNAADTNVTVYVGAFDDGLNLTTPATANGTNDPNEFIALWGTTSESNQVHEGSSYGFVSGADISGNLHYETRYIELNDPALSGGDIAVVIYSTNGAGAGSVTAFLDGWLITDESQISDQAVNNADALIDVSDSPYTAPISLRYILADTSGGAIVVNLPSLVGNGGKIYDIKNIAGGSNITINPDGSDTIDGDPSISIAGGTGASVTIRAASDESAWYIH